MISSLVPIICKGRRRRMIAGRRQKNTTIKDRCILLLLLFHSFRSLSNPKQPHGKGMKILKENGMLCEAWFINGLRKGQGRSICDGLIVFIGEFFDDIPYRGMKEYEDGATYEGYFKDG